MAIGVVVVNVLINARGHSVMPVARNGDGADHGVIVAVRHRVAIAAMLLFGIVGANHGIGFASTRRVADGKRIAVAVGSSQPMPAWGVKRRSSLNNPRLEGWAAPCWWRWHGCFIAMNADKVHGVAIAGTTVGANKAATVISNRFRRSRPIIHTVMGDVKHRDGKALLSMPPAHQLVGVCSNRPAVAAVDATVAPIGYGSTDIETAAPCRDNRVRLAVAHTCRITVVVVYPKVAIQAAFFS